MGVLIPSKIGLILRASTTGQQLADAVTNAATVQPPFAQRKVKYRKAPGIGAGTLYRVDPEQAAREIGMPTPPAVATDVDIFGAVIRVLLNADQQRAEARYMCVQLPQNPGRFSFIVGFPWAEALARRTNEFLGQWGVRSEIELVKARG